MYLRPALISEALNGRAIPFVEDAVSSNPELRLAIEQLLSASMNLDEDLESTENLTTLADVLLQLSGQAAPSSDKPNLVTLYSIKEQFESDPTTAVSMKELEASHSMSRYSITRQFKRYRGTSPHRFLIMRRLAYAKGRLLAGVSLADAASESGFSDQSHMTRHFRHAFGVSPYKWLHISLETK